MLNLPPKVWSQIAACIISDVIMQKSVQCAALRQIGDVCKQPVYVMQTVTSC